ncbi:RNA polymerase sigma factor SigZ [Cohnella xylanilytica]|uniref:RNA polymerase sigma factor SigZ n=1 Tax=Cohnella xylanilytica TaxID=557555 RepID=UPI001B0A6F1A|nr:RNA polymerase sigma factor SigZ [Cohnella xylanilytica]GIO13794.1 RNA polymerase sigma factor SigZ [Cohnella xylanilytica]
MNIETVWREYQEPVQRFVRNRARSEADADDIVQTAFLKIYANQDQLKDERKLKPWIYQIVRNAIVDHYRKQRRTEEISEELPAPGEEAERDYSREVIACFESTIPHLPEVYREALVLSELRGLSQKELAERLGISYSAAKSRVQRGREMLRRLLTGCCHIETDAYGNIVDFRILSPEPKPLKRNRRADGCGDGLQRSP